MSDKQQPLRRSCQFCRLRKIRCSGLNQCEACRERNIECIYAREATKGRPKKTSRPQVRESSSTSEASARLSPSAANTPRQSSYTNAPLKSTSAVLDQGHWPETGAALAMDIQAIFLQQNFGYISKSRSRGFLFMRAIRTFNQKAAAAEDETMSSTSLSSELVWPPVVHYDGFLEEITLDVVRMLCAKFGRLGTPSSAKFYVRAHRDDRSETAFPNYTADAKDTLPSISPVRIKQLIDSWFSLNPLAIICSKSMLLSQYEAGEADEILLSVILGDALYMNGTVGNTAGDEYFKRAINLMHTRVDDKTSLSIVQATLLLGWHELCLGRARSSTCFFTYSTRHVNRRIDWDGFTDLGSIHGISIRLLQDELYRNLHAFQSLLTLYAFMQFDHPFAEFVPSKHMYAETPAPDHSKSLVMELDEITGNVSNAKRKSQLVRQLWTINNITSIVIHIYALYPWPTEPKTPTLSFSIDKLREIHLLKQDMRSLCDTIREVLAESSAQISSQVEDESRLILLAVNHTLVIHLLFYRDENKLHITDEKMYSFNQAAQQLIDLLRSSKNVEPHSNLEILISAPKTLFLVDLMFLGLDSLIRSLDYLTLVIVPTNWVAGLTELCNELVAIVEGDVLITKGLVQASKRLQKVRHRLESQASVEANVQMGAEMDSTLLEQWYPYTTEEVVPLRQDWPYQSEEIDPEHFRMFWDSLNTLP